MERTIIAMTMAAGLVIAMAAAQLADSPQDVSPGADINDLGWLEGQWKGTIGEDRWEACYTSPEAGVVLSANKEIKDGRVAMIEFEHFYVHEDKVMLSPYPHGRKSKTVFEMIESDTAARRAVFAADNDFPAKIVYHRVADDRLVIDLFARDAPPEAKPMRIDLKRR